MDPEGEPRTVRLRVDLSYDGTAFSGWAAQPGRRTVEDVLAAALGRALRLPSSPRLTVAGRTDAGVHARGGDVHMDDLAASVHPGVGTPGHRQFRGRRQPQRSSERCGQHVLYGPPAGLGGPPGKG